MNQELYYYNNEPLQLSYANDYTPLQKIEIVNQLNDDFTNGNLSWDQMRWNIENARFGSFTVMRIVDKLMFDGKLKTNPITNNTRTYYKKSSPFDL